MATPFVMANNTLDRTAGAHALAAAGQRERSPHKGTTTARRVPEIEPHRREHRNGIDVWAYLQDVLARIPTHPNRRRAGLLPRHWKAERASAQP
jgi:hypothetical protein